MVVRRPLVLTAGVVKEIPVGDFVPAATPSESANAVAFVQRLRDDLGDVSWLVVGDSTGNEVTEWVYLTAQTLAARYPTYTVIYHLWDATGGAAYDTGAAGSATTIQTGSGSNTLHIWNCSVAGSGTFYVRGQRWAAAVLATNPDWITVNQGHNEGTSAAGGTADIWRAQMAALTESLTEAFPITPLAIVLQNPRGDGVADVQRRSRAYRELAALRGYGVIDAQSVFLAAPGFPAGLISGDNLHPTTAGSQLWADEVARVLTYSPESRPRYQGPSLLTQPATGLVRGDFADFPAPPTLPGWSAVNCAPAKDARAGWVESPNGYSIRLQASSAAQTSIFADVPAGLVDLLKGRYVTAAVRMKVPSGQATTAGRVQLQDSAGTYASPGSADLRDAWHWAVATKKIDAATTFVRVRIYVDSGTSGSADISVASVHLVIGSLPRISSPSTTIPVGAAGGSLAGTFPNPTIAAGAVGGTEIAAAIKDPSAGTAGLRTLGASATSAAAGNDSRLSDARTPTAHKTSHATGGGDALTPSDIGAQPVNTDLTTIAGLTATTDNVIQSVAGAWASRTMAQLKTALALVKGDVGLGNVTNDAQIPVSAVDAKGDLLAGTAADTVARLAVGTNGHVLTADSAETAGVKWAAPTGGSVAPRTLSTSSSAENIAGDVAGDMQITCTTSGTLTLTPTGTPNGRVFAIEALASGAQRTVTLAGAVLLPASGGPTTRTLVIPQNSIGKWLIGYSSLRTTPGWYLLAAQVI